MARISFCAKVTALPDRVSLPGARIYSGNSSSYWNSSGAASVLKRPSFNMRSARKSSATALTTPDPHNPDTFLGCLGFFWITEQVALPVRASTLTASMAPEMACMPCRMEAPSNAGPVAHEVAENPSLPRKMISPLVPTSASRVPWACAPRSAARVAPTISAPRNPEMSGRVRTSAAGLNASPRLPAVTLFSSLNSGS